MKTLTDERKERVLNDVWDKTGNFLRTSPSGIAITPEISSVTTTDGNWTAVATGLTGIVKWRIAELNGNDFYYAYVAAPGDNFNVGFGWVSYDTGISALYVKRPASVDVTVKFEKWTR